MRKYCFLIFAFGLCNPGFSQNPILSNIEDTKLVSSVLHNNSNGHSVLQDSKLMFDNAGSDYQSSDNITIHSRKQTIPYFEMRRLNSYYRDMEEWRRQERMRLKRIGAYDRVSIEQLYAP
jgi:hypothetical protein